MKIEADIIVNCEGCGKELDLSQNGNGKITAAPCVTCMEEEKQAGYESAQEDERQKDERQKDVG